MTYLASHLTRLLSIRLRHAFHQPSLSSRPKFNNLRNPPVSPATRRWLDRGALLLLLALTFWARTYNWADVFQEDGHIYFLDGDCYSRMTRARMVCEGQWVIRHHDFENWPQGTTPHTTAPLDWMIVGLKVVCDGVVRLVDWKGTCGIRGQTLDLAGALISPLLGVLTAAWLWFWARWVRLPYRAAMLFYFAVSPILVHGFELGRPDHQSLLILLAAVAIGAELALIDPKASPAMLNRWAVTAGVGWGLSLWTSLYEPTFLFVGAMTWLALSNRGALLGKDGRGRWIALGIVLAVAFLIDGWRLSWPDETLQKYFGAWSRSISELQHLDLTTRLVGFWFGLFWCVAPVLLWLAGRIDRRAYGILMLCIFTLLLTMWQVRWGYFLALMLTLSLPWQLGVFKQWWLAWAIGVVGMLPLCWSWESVLNPSAHKREQQVQTRLMQQECRRMAEQMQSSEHQPFLAGWSDSPQIAYWSKQPGVAGSSHQSLGGIVDASRFFLAAGAEEGAAILRKRQIRWVVVEGLPTPTALPGQFSPVWNAARLLGVPIGPEPLGWTLAKATRGLPSYLEPYPTRSGNETGASANPEAHYRLYRVAPDRL